MEHITRSLQSVMINGTNGAQVTLTGSYEDLLYTQPNGRNDGHFGVPLTMNNLTLNDGRGSTTAWEYWYLGSDAPTVTFNNVTFTEGYMVGSTVNASETDHNQTANFNNCTFEVLDSSGQSEDRTNHYELWLSGQAIANVDGCTFTPNNYGAIKGSYNNTYPTHYPNPHVELTVTNSTFNGIGTHSVVHLDGVDAITFQNNTITNSVTGDRSFIDTKLDNTDGGQVAAINNDYFNGNTNNNTVQYSLVLNRDGQQVTSAPAYYQYNQSMTTYDLDGYTYNLSNGQTLQDTAEMLPAGSNPGRYPTGYHAFTAGALSGDEATSIPVGSNTPRSYDLTQPVPNTYTIAFNANGGTGSMGSITATYDHDVTLPANTFTRAGYTFAGWNTAADGTGTAYVDGASVSNLTQEAGATVTLYAQWTQNNSGQDNTKPAANTETSNGGNGGTPEAANNAAPEQQEPAQVPEAKQAQPAGEGTPQTSDGLMPMEVVILLVVASGALTVAIRAALRRRHNN